jgi:DNA-binding transcriptional MocR family regulator
VTFVPSTTLYAARNDRRGIRLAFTNPSTKDIQRGCAELCNSIRQELVMVNSTKQLQQRN